MAWVVYTKLQIIDLLLSMKNFKTNNTYRHVNEYLVKRVVILIMIVISLILSPNGSNVISFVYRSRMNLKIIQQCYVIMYFISKFSSLINIDNKCVVSPSNDYLNHLKSLYILWYVWFIRQISFLTKFYDYNFYNQVIYLLKSLLCFMQL